MVELCSVGGWVRPKWLDIASTVPLTPGSLTGGFVVSMWNDARFNQVIHPKKCGLVLKMTNLCQLHWCEVKPILLSHAAPEIHHHSTIPSHCEVMIKFIHWFQPLWNILISQLGWLFSIYEKIRNVPNHQSVQILHRNSSVYIPMFHGWIPSKFIQQIQSVGCGFLSFFQLSTRRIRRKYERSNWSNHHFSWWSPMKNRIKSTSNPHWNHHQIP